MKIDCDVNRMQETRSTKVRKDKERGCRGEQAAVGLLGAGWDRGPTRGGDGAEGGRQGGQQRDKGRVRVRSGQARERWVAY